MESKFTGSLLSLIVTNFVSGLIVAVTLGFGTPWAVCYRQRWFTENTVIDGRRLKFDGTGGELFGQYIKWLLLSLITCGIYLFWLQIKMQQWVAEHTHFE